MKRVLLFILLMFTSSCVTAITSLPTCDLVAEQFREDSMKKGADYVISIPTPYVIVSVGAQVISEYDINVHMLMMYDDNPPTYNYDGDCHLEEFDTDQCVYRNTKVLYYKSCDSKVSR